jgi:hypothetical protein
VPCARIERQDQSPSRFEAGTHGGYEALLFAFHEQRPPEALVVRIAISEFDEEQALGRFRLVEFEGKAVEQDGSLLVAE